MSLELSHTPRYLGRAPTNDLVFTDRSVSSRHAAVFTSAGRVFVEDLGSRNGTFVGERRVRKRCELKPGEDLVLGNTVRLALESDGEDIVGVQLVLEQLDGALHIPLPAGVLRIGPEHPADLCIPKLSCVIELCFTGERGSLTPIGIPAEARAIRIGEPFALGESNFRVVRAAPHLSGTAEPDLGSLPYRLTVTLSGPTGPVARLAAPGRSAALEWTAPNRAVLLYLLARKLDADRRAGVGPQERGWCSDSEVALGLWGREGIDRNLNVLVTRVRNDLRAAGLDPWMIEKRQGHVRLKLEQVEVEL